MRSVGCILLLSWACGAWASDPVLDFAYPAGGRPGSEFEIEVGGRSLQEVTQTVVSGEGVKATFVGPVRTVTYSKKGKAIVTPVPNLFRFKVVVEKEAAPGLRSLRVGTAYRLSEPVGFEIADLPVLCESVTNRAAKGEAQIAALPVCLDGRIHGPAGDRYRFEAKKGMTVVALAESRVRPFGGFCPALAFEDAAGKACEGVVLQANDETPAAVFEVPQDGVYALTVKAAGKAVGDACVYRVKLGELPLITGFSPPGAKEGESLNVKLSGYNLAQKRVRLFTGGKDGALCLETLSAGAFVLPGLRFDLAGEPDVAENEPNDAAASAQPVEVPGAVNGRLDAAGGRDLYRFSGAAGSVVCVEVRAAALGSALKAAVTVRNAKGETLAAAAFNTNATLRAAVQARDPSVILTLADAGPYEVEVADLEGRAGEAFFYRLRVGPPEPDFLAWMTPASLCIPADGSALVTVYLQRLHGFNGEVRVALDFPPLSIACEGGVIPAGADSCLMTVSTDGVRYPRTVFGLSLTASAEIGGRLVKRTAVPVRFESLAGRTEARPFAELSAKAAPGLRALRLDVPPKAPVAVTSAAPLRLTVLSPNLATHLGGLYEPTVVWPPRGFTVQGVQATNKQERAAVLLKVNPKALPPGASGQLILGCVQKGDLEKKVMAVTQSVPFVIK